MADKAITDLNVAPTTVDDNNTWFAVAQSGTAYKLSGHEFILALGTVLNGHGGINSIVYTPPVSPSLTGSMVITLADNSTTTVSVENGKGISSIAKTGTLGLVDTYTVTYNDATTSTFTVTNGAKGDQGDAWYVHIRYAGAQPTADSDMGTTPDDWIGLYSGTSSTAPVHYTDYDWFKFKGDTGATGAASSIQSTAIEYQESMSGTSVPQSTWTTTVPAVTQGNYLWTRTTVTFNSGAPVVWYSVARFGLDGSGSVITVNSQSPDGSGNVALDASDIPTNDSSDVQTKLTNIASEQATQNGNIATLATSFAATYSSSSNYAVGDYCTYNRTLYKCTTAVSSEAWDATKWSVVALATDVKAKQNTLVSGTNIKTVNGQSLLGSGNVAAISTGSNLLYNWFFGGGGSQNGYGYLPINQRGQANYSGNEWTIDRWFSNNANLSVTVNSNNITVSNSDSSNRRIFEQHCQRNFVGQTVTASLLQANGTLTTLTGVVPTTNGQNISTEFGAHRLRIETKADNITFAVWVGTSSSLSIVAVKLELGTSQTLAHQENGVWVLNEIPNYAEELAKCQAYYYKTNLTNATYGTIGLGSADSATSFNAIVSFPVTMSKQPTVSFVGTVSFQVGNNAYTKASPTVSVYNFSSGSCQVHFDGLSGLTIGAFGYVFSQGNGYLVLDAEST